MIESHRRQTLGLQGCYLYKKVKRKKVECGFELSLIKSVKPITDMNSIDLVVFSGSNSHTARITLANRE